MPLPKTNYVHLKNGKFFETTSEDLRVAFQQFKLKPPASGWALHFHGGFVDSRTAIETAEKLLPHYQASQTYPLFYVWETGAWETVINNLLDISHESFFKTLLEKLATFIKSKLGWTSTTGAGLEGVSSDDQADLRLMEDTKPAINPAATDIVEADLRQELEAYWSADLELKTAYDNLNLRVEQARGAPFSESVARGDNQGVLPSAAAQQALFPARSEESITEGMSLIWLGRVAIVAARIGRRALLRLVQARDHGWYTTLVEETLRELYADKVGTTFFWNQIKQDAGDAFQADAAQYGGTAFLEMLKGQITSDGQAPRVTLVAHGAGANFVSQFLLAAERILPPGVVFDLVLIAPAIDCTLAAKAKESNRIDSIRVFGLSDQLESKDAMLAPISGWLRGLYPRSALYFISGLLETETDAPLLGMQRYYDASRYPDTKFPELQKVRDYLQQGSDRLVWSVDDDGPGRKSSATQHRDFEFDLDTLESVKHILQHGFASAAELDRGTIESALSSFSIQELFELAKQFPGIKLDHLEHLHAAIENSPIVQSALAGKLDDRLTAELLKVAEHLPGGTKQLLVCAHRIKPGAQLLRHLRDQPLKMDMNLEKAISSAATAFESIRSFESVSMNEAVPEEVPSEPKLPILIGLADPASDLEDVTGLEIVSKIGRIVAAKASQTIIDQLGHDDRVVSVELSRNNAHYECVKSIPFIGVIDNSTQQRLAEQGDKCLVAIVDADIDVLHAAFREPDQIDAAGQVVRGKSRIHAVWDQTDPTGPPPPGMEGMGGTLHTSIDIDNYIRAGAVGKNLLRVNGGHGTHVASIAAGSPIPSSNFPGGVASQAKLVIVVAGTGQFEEGSPNSLGYSLFHNAALNFIDQAATALKLPVVINLSQGMNAGAHDGSSLVEAMFDDFCQKGRRAGRVIVKSAGNDRDSAGHAFVTVNSNQVETLEWESPTMPRGTDLIDIWFDSSSELTFRILSPTGGQSERVTFKDRRKSGSFPSGNSYDLRYERFCVDNGASRLQVEIGRGTATNIEVGTSAAPWTLGISAGALQSTAELDAWVDRTARVLPKFIRHVSEDRTLSVPGTAASVIAVGAVGSQVPLRVGKFSAYGTTRDGRKKPEVSAPGVDIMAAAGNTNDALRVSTGTSMAAPHVTGAIALVLSACKKDPALTVPNAGQISAALKVMRNQAWDRGVGYGCLDVQALMNILATPTTGTQTQNVV